MLASALPARIQKPFADTGTKNTIPVPSQISITPGAASFTDGFPPLTFTALSAGGIPPDGADMNGVLNQITAVQRWQSAGGFFNYNLAFSTAIGGYPAGAILKSTDGLSQWLNLTDNNTTDPDDVASVGWVAAAAYGITAVTGLTNANVTLTPLQYRNGLITLAGTLTGNIQIIFPTHLQRWTVIDNTTGAFSVTCKTAAGTGPVAQQGATVIIAGDGTNLISTGIATPTTLTTKLPDIDVTQATGAITVALNTAIYQDFRSTTLTDGTPSTVLCDPADLVIPDGATLGAVTTVAADIVVLMLNNAGTAEFAVVNVSGGVNLDQSGVISTTAIGTGSDSGNVVYSTTARTNLAYKVVKRFTAVNTAGSWASPTAVADIDSATMSSNGFGQVFTTYVAAGVGTGRVVTTTYYNTTAKERKVYIQIAGTANITATLTNGTVIPQGTSSCFFAVPPSIGYTVTLSSSTIYNWLEQG